MLSLSPCPTHTLKRNKKEKKSSANTKCSTIQLFSHLYIQYIERSILQLINRRKRFSAMNNINEILKIVFQRDEIF